MKSILTVVLLALVFLTACAPTSTPQPTVIPQSTDTATPLPTPANKPTNTSVPTATITSTPTPDYSVIKYENLYFSGATEMVFVFALNNARGEFHLNGNEYSYECKPSTDNSDKLLCRGAFQAPGREVIFKLFEARQADPLLTLDIIIPSLYPPTPEGMKCEIEPLDNFIGRPGCYAVTCYLNGSYYDGTPNTCIQPWRWPVP